MTTEKKHPGVRYLKKLGKWKAEIYTQGKTIYLGLFNSFEEAVQAKKDAEAKYPKRLNSRYKAPFDPLKMVDDIGFESNFMAMMHYNCTKKITFGKAKRFASKKEENECFNFDEEDDLLLEDIRRQVKLQYENEKVM